MGGGGGGSPISTIANNVTQGVQHLGSDIQNNPGAYLGAGAFGPAGAVGGSLIDASMKKPDQPTAPGVDPGLASTLQAQQQNAQQFRSNLGTNEAAAGQNLAVNANQQLNKNLQAQTSSDNSRGLLYGGINEGHNQAQRASSATQLAQGRESINDNYQTAANQMDAAAVGTGVAVQQSQQAVQDQIYNQALMNMANQNKAFGSLATAGGMAGGMALA